VILNSLAGDAIPRNLRLLRPFGRMLELGKRDFYENSQVGLRPFATTFRTSASMRTNCWRSVPTRAPRVRRFDGLVRRRHLQPLPHRPLMRWTLPVPSATMQASRHIGKIVVTFPRDFAPLAPKLAEAPPVAIRADTNLPRERRLVGLRAAHGRAAGGHGARHLCS